MATKTHSFHIPVMGIGFTIDTPLKVSHFGIDSVISLIDDMLIEKLRKMYCGKHGLAYHEITKETEDHRAKRITAYLDLLNTLAKEKFERLKTSLAEKSVELRDYRAILPDGSGIKRHLNRMIHDNASFTDIKEWIMNNLSMGSIDVNIMTKVQRANYGKGGVLPVEYNDALSALRGYANSGLNSSIIFSAGMNPALYGYMAKFDDFFPDKSGEIKKKIVLKVSDYRSALIQGKFLAGKGLWVSEYRIESGLNCGGHAFASTGNLMGPILSEFRDRREELHQTVYERFLHGLSGMKRHIPHKRLPIKISAQGGVGTAVEHRFLLDHYHVDSVGWGTPFLLVPEVT
ncbi:MAG: hypothetical protein ACE5DN_07720, partial [Flavobacteriales bacterium]